jgi:AbrB family looped-hinge helix DNA binding protein
MKNCKKELFGAVCGTGVLGARGQIVIPKEARDRLQAKEGDRFLFIEHYGKIVMVPEEEMTKIMKEVTKHIKKIK